MHITWHGQYTIKIVSKNDTIILDPLSPDGGLSPLRGKATVVALTNPTDPAMSHISGISGQPLIIDTPGEYAFDDITLHATSWHDEQNREHSLHRWVIEDMVILHLGALNRPLTDEELQQVERTGVDILFISVGGGSGLNTEQSLSLIGTIEPRMVIPINYKVKGLKEDLESVETFASELGYTGQPEKKLLIKANKLPQEDMQTVILAPA